MRKSLLPKILLFTAAVSIPATIPDLHAAPVIGPWTSAQGDGPILNGDTASPTVGDGTAESAEAEMIHSFYTPLTLANSGDKIIFTGSVTLSGTVNSPATGGAPRTQFRFGLFDGDNSSTSGWVGYLMHNRHGNAGTPAGALVRKNVGNTTLYHSTASGASTLTSVQGDGTAASLFNDDTYSMSLTIERSGDDLIITGLLTGANGFFQSLNFTDTSASTLGTYTFDSVGFLLGGNLDADLVEFADLDVTLVPVPEPTTWALMLTGLGTGAVLLRRRKL